MHIVQTKTEKYPVRGWEPAHLICPKVNGKLYFALLPKQINWESYKGKILLSKKKLFPSWTAVFSLSASQGFL